MCARAILSHVCVWFLCVIQTFTAHGSTQVVSAKMLACVRETMSLCVGVRERERDSERARAREREREREWALYTEPSSTDTQTHRHTDTQVHVCLCHFLFRCVCVYGMYQVKGTLTLKGKRAARGGKKLAESPLSRDLPYFS